MTKDELYQIYDGPIPETIKQVMPCKALNYYYFAYLKQVEARLLRHCHETLETIQLWRMIDLYPDDIKEKMLIRLSRALAQARFSALEISESLNSVSPLNSV